MDLTFWSYEKQFILHESVTPLSSECNDIVEAVFGLVGCGSYVEALHSPACQKLLSYSSKQTADSLEQHITTAVQAQLDQDQSSSIQQIVFCTGIAGLQLFVQSNFTGPPLVPSFFEVFPSLVKHDDSNKDIQKVVFEFLAEDTEGVYPLLKNPEYLMLAKILFFHLNCDFSSCVTFDWWALRCNMLLQIIADETSSVIYDRIEHYILVLENSDKLGQDSRIKAQFCLEAGQAYLLFSDVGKASKFISLGEDALKLKSSLTGALGKRTKYQVDPKSQLLLKVEYSDVSILAEEMEGPKLLPKDLPRDVLLNDDTRLPNIKFENEDEDKVPSLTPLEQLSLLSSVQHKRRSQATDMQLKEVTKAYLNALLQYPKCWVIQYNALRLRSLLESEESRAVDRALQQLEELVECVRRDEPSRFERSKLFYASSLPATWVTKQEYGRLLVQMGCIKSALELFEELQLWEDVIDCYNRIGMRQRSALILQELIDKEGTPKLWCLLGDATDNTEHYYKAWDLSGERSSRAQRCLGDYYFHRRDYTKAIDHYTISCNLNHLQLTVWQNLAYAALQVEDWKLCCSAYKKCTLLDPDFFEFWNNLAKAYVQLNDMEKAFICLEEAIRCKSDSWKMFENFMIVATSLGKFGNALYAYSRLLALKPRHINLLVISGMVGAMMDEEANGALDEQFYKKLVTFLSQMCQSCPSESDLWYYYGQAVSCNPTPTAESRDMACQHFRKSLAMATRSSDWYRQPQQVVNALKKLIRMEKALVVSIEGVAPQTALNNVRSVAMMADNVMMLSQKGLTNVASGEVVPFAVDSLKEAQETQLRVKKLIDSLVVASSI